MTSKERAGMSIPFIGNSDVLKRLDGKVRSGRLPHAIIFSGPAGIGKRTCALRLARMLNCTDQTSLPCGHCSQCRKIVAGTHSDVFSLNVTEGASQIKVEQVRTLRSMLNLQPMEGRVKFYLIDPAERMSPGAANALLKALEEPPPKTYFVLITENVNALLLTIRSRSQVYHFSPLTREEVRRCGIEDELVVRWSRGSIGWALSIDASTLRETRDSMCNFLEWAMQASNEELAGLPAASAELSRSKEDYGERLRILTVLVADLIFLHEGLDDRLVNIDIETRLRQLASGTTSDRLVQIGDCLKSIEVNLKQHLNKQLVADFLALTLNKTTSKMLNDKTII